MKKILSLLILFPGLMTGCLFAQYYLEKAPDAPGIYKKTSHTTSRDISSAENKKAMQMMDGVVDVVKKVYPQPVGVDVGPYGGISDNYRGVSEFKNGPYKYYVIIPFFEMYKIRSGGLESSGEYTSSLKIWINEARYILQVNPVQYGNDYVFRAPRPGIPVNGFPKYNNMLMILPGGKRLPWRPATKQEYLENFIAGLKMSLPGRTSTSQEMQLIPDAEQLLASMSPAEKKQIAYLRKGKYDNKNGFGGVGEFGYTAWGNNKWAGFQDASDTTAEQLVIIDENFYDKTLPRYSLQLIVIERVSPPASYSASAPTISERMNTIVRAKEFSNNLQQLLGKDGMDYIAGNQKTAPDKKDKKYVPGKIDHKNIDRIVDSMFRNYRVELPSMPTSSSPGVQNSAAPELPSRKENKLRLAARKLQTREELVSYLDELDRKFSGGLAETTVANYDAARSNSASFGYWLMNKPYEALMLAIRAAKQQPDNNTAINNLGTTLSLCGVDYLAIPLYIVCIKNEPDNSTITNNLGQAFLGLGDLQQAELYLRKAISTSPYHPHANNSLGLIYQKQGKKDQAIECYENSLRGSFTLEGINGLKRLKSESALKLMNYIRHRYRQPDYINFDKYPIPGQCLKVEETEIRIAEHKAYQKILSDQISKYDKLRKQQEPLAGKALQDVILRGQQGKAFIKSFQPFATAVVVSLRKEYEDKIIKLGKDLKEVDMKWTRMKLEYEEALKQVIDSFEPRLEAQGEGNPDPSLDEDICEAKNQVANYYLPLLGEINEERFTKIIHAHKDYLNDFLYWVRLAVSSEDEYRFFYYDIVLSVLHLLQQVKLTTLHDVCLNVADIKVKNPGNEFKEPDCPLPVGIEIPFVIGKIEFDCESWGIEGGEGFILNIEHKFGAETTIAFGAGLALHLTPKIGSKKLDLSPGVEAEAKGQLFITFDGNMVSDGGFLWEAKIEAKGIGKPVEAKQAFTWAVNKGFTAEGPLTAAADKIFDVPPEKQINKNVKPFKPNQ